MLGNTNHMLANTNFQKMRGIIYVFRDKRYEKKQWTETGRSTGGFCCYKKPGKGVNQWEML